MIKHLWIKFLLLLIVIAAVGLSASFLLSEFMIRDFREYLEGEREDRVYWIMAALESSYEKFSGWKKDNLIENTLWGLMLGFETRLIDVDGNLIIDTEMAVQSLSPLVTKRIMAMSRPARENRDDSFTPYALFLAGREIGRLEVNFLPPKKEGIFIKRANRFLLITLLTLGGVSLFLGILFSRKMTRPIKELTSAASDIAGGNYRSRVVISGRDEISRLSEGFNRMAQSLELQESLRKKLTSNIAHELRTPLSAVRGELEGMMDGYILPDKENLQSLYAEIGRLKHILEGIEELSRAEASSLSLNRRELPLRSFLINIMERFKNVFDEKGVLLELECDDQLVLNADPDSLSQILINLIANALRATERGGAVKIKAYRNDSAFHIEIADEGCGIREADLPHIFERFYRASEGGLGLGLAIVRELVEAHEGRITVQSTFGRGSVFTVTFPL